MADKSGESDGAADLASPEQPLSKQRAHLLLALAGIVFVVVVLGGMYLLWTRGRISDEVLVALGVTAGGLFFGSGLLAYLGDDGRRMFTEALFETLRAGGLPSLSRGESLSNGLREAEFRALVYRLQRSMARARSAVALTEADRVAVITAVTEGVRADIGPQLIESLETKYGGAAASSMRLAELRSLGERTRERLLNEVVALSKRSNLNLVIGIVTTTAAVGLLSFIVLTAELQVPDWRTLVPGYLLRLSLVVFIEIFAFFFLRMYKASLQEIRYFQNELTSIEAKFIALEAALRVDDADGARAIITQLGSVERNQPLQHGQSTVELERLKLENGMLKELLSTVSRFSPGQSTTGR